MTEQDQQRRRRQVLDRIFPAAVLEEEDLLEEQFFSCRSLRFNVVLGLYEFPADMEEEEQEDEDVFCCSICLEAIQPYEADIRPVCQHMYHRDCLMDWMVQDNNDCPQCRAPLWDEATFQMLEKGLLQQLKDAASERRDPPNNPAYTEAPMRNSTEGQLATGSNNTGRNHSRDNNNLINGLTEEQQRISYASRSRLVPLLTPQQWRQQRIAHERALEEQLRNEAKRSIQVIGCAVLLLIPLLGVLLWQLA